MKNLSLQDEALFVLGGVEPSKKEEDQVKFPRRTQNCPVEMCVSYAQESVNITPHGKGICNVIKVKHLQMRFSWIMPVCWVLSHKSKLSRLHRCGGKVSMKEISPLTLRMWGGGSWKKKKSEVTTLPVPDPESVSPLLTPFKPASSIRFLFYRKCV